MLHIVCYRRELGSHMLWDNIGEHLWPRNYNILWPGYKSNFSIHHWEIALDIFHYRGFCSPSLRNWIIIPIYSKGKYILFCILKNIQYNSLFLSNNYGYLTIAIIINMLKKWLWVIRWIIWCSQIIFPIWVFHDLSALSDQSTCNPSIFKKWIPYIVIYADAILTTISPGFHIPDIRILTAFWMQQIKWLRNIAMLRSQWNSSMIIVL